MRNSEDTAAKEVAERLHRLHLENSKSKKKLLREPIEIKKKVYLFSASVLKDTFKRV